MLDWGGWGGIGVGLAWVITGCLLVAGLIGCIIPVLPGHLILILAAFAHWLMLRETSGVEWWTFAVLIVMAAISQTLEFVSGAAGARWFGGSRWGAAGALIGGIVGMFFFPFGLLLGPLIGAFLFEFGFARKKLRPSTVSGVGSVAGTLGGMIIKVALGVLMVGYFLVDVIWI
jgi:uncharacterized protein YqgC (DUF456 family)